MRQRRENPARYLEKLSWLVGIGDGVECTPGGVPMSAQRNATAWEKEQKLGEVLAAYLEAEEDGRPPHRSELLAQNPDVVTELKAFFDNRERFASLPDRLRSHVATRVRPDGSSSVTRRAVFLQAGMQLGDYEILKEIARGGMGIVYRVRQLSLNREVALKTILARGASSPTVVRRFRIEAEAAALLDHPHIVPIYEVGETGGQPYFTMKLIEGGSLASRFDEYRLKPGLVRASRKERQAQIAHLMATVARAVHHAHQRGILHRDLKPANILLHAPDAGTASTRVPMVTDFGLAKRIDEVAGLTQLQIIVGTAAYMAPEQAMRARRVDHGDRRLQPGVDPLRALDGRGALGRHHVLRHNPQGARRAARTAAQHNAEIAPDLGAICMKCLEKEPERRYPTALELALDLERYCSGEAVSLRPHGPLERGLRRRGATRRSQRSCSPWRA